MTHNKTTTVPTPKKSAEFYSMENTLAAHKLIG